MSVVRAHVGEPIRAPYDTRIMKAWLVIAGDYSGRLTPSGVDRLSTFAGLRGAVTEQQGRVGHTHRRNLEDAVAGQQLVLKTGAPKG